MDRTDKKPGSTTWAVRVVNFRFSIRHTDFKWWTAFAQAQMRFYVNEPLFREIIELILKILANSHSYPQMEFNFAHWDFVWIIQFSDRIKGSLLYFQYKKVCIFIIFNDILFLLYYLMTFYVYYIINIVLYLLFGTFTFFISRYILILLHQ